MQSQLPLRSHTRCSVRGRDSEIRNLGVRVGILFPFGIPFVYLEFTCFTLYVSGTIASSKRVMKNLCAVRSAHKMLAVAI